MLYTNGVEILDNSHIANINPFRYRGYYYDTETGLYYLGSRYYNPKTCRFITPDDLSVVVENLATTVNGMNIYAYCNNNPMNYVDKTGDKAYLITAFNYSSGGLPVVGHSAILFEDEEGDLTLFEFSASKANKKETFIAKKEASVISDSVNNGSSENSCSKTDVISYCNSRYTDYWIDELDWVGQNSFDKATKIFGDGKENAYNGKYNLLTNNCLSFVQDVLSVPTGGESPFINSLVNTNVVVPAVFHAGIKAYYAYEEVKKQIDSLVNSPLVNSFKKLFNIE